MGLVVGWAGDVPAATVLVDSTQTLQQALHKAVDGDHIDILAGDYRGQVAVIVHKQLTLRGVGGRPVLHADGRSAEGKAILVVRDGDIRIENIEFRGARVADRNGAGIRFERGRLLVQRCAFVDNENGILTANADSAELTVQDSEFADAPDGPPLPHLIYVGRIARFTLSGSRVSGGRNGHLVKSRARTNHILYNQLLDGAGGRAGYELEFPNGGLAFVVGNVIGQSRDTSNPAIVSFGAEGNQGQREHGLFMANNTLINDGLRPAVFVRVHEQGLGGPVAQRFVNNLLVGLGVGELGLADVTHDNFTVVGGTLRDAGTGSFRLDQGSWLRGLGVAPGQVHGVSLVPTAEFVLPAGTRQLPVPARWSPGADQN